MPPFDGAYHAKVFYSMPRMLLCTATSRPQVTGMDPQAFVEALQRDHGVLMGAGYFGGSTVRAMTHLDVDQEGVERAIDASRAVLTLAAHGASS